MAVDLMALAQCRIQHNEPLLNRYRPQHLSQQLHLSHKIQHNVLLPKWQQITPLRPPHHSHKIQHNEQQLNKCKQLQLVPEQAHSHKIRHRELVLLKWQQHQPGQAPIHSHKTRHNELVLLKWQQHQLGQVQARSHKIQHNVRTLPSAPLLPPQWIHPHLFKHQAKQVVVPQQPVMFLRPLFRLPAKQDAVLHE
jgi:hypothetical protein